MSIMAKERPPKIKSGDRGEPVPPVPQGNADEEWITRSVRFPPNLYERVEAAGEAARRSQYSSRWRS